MFSQEFKFFSYGKAKVRSRVVLTLSQKTNDWIKQKISRKRNISLENSLSGHNLSSFLGKGGKENVTIVEEESQKLQCGKTVGIKITMVKNKTSPKVNILF